MGLVWAAVFFAGPPAQAQTYIPKDDAEIVEVVPSSAAIQGLRRLRSALARDPDNFDLAIRVARRLIETSRSEGDPRYLGYAQSVLAKWWQGSQPELVVLRATIRQSVHEFDAALSDLKQVTQARPDDAQALLTQATIEQVLGRYPEARKSCEALNALAANLVAQACLADVRSLTGDGSVIEPLNKRLESDQTLDPGSRAWLHTLLAEMLERHGQIGAAQAHYEAAMKQSPDLYTRAALADLLLSQGQAEAALRAVGAPSQTSATNPVLGKQVPDVLLLRQVLALHALGRADQLKPALADLRARFRAARDRGQSLHGREEARLVLSIDGHANAALKLAKDNWAIQKEAADTLVLAQAALAAGDRATVTAIKTFVADTGFHDQRLNTLLARSDAIKGAAQ